MFTVVFFPLKVHHLPVTRCLSVFLTVAEHIPSALTIWSNRKTAMTMRAVLKFEKWKLQRVAPSGTTRRTLKSGLKQKRGTGPSTFGTLNHTVSCSIFSSVFLFNISKQPDLKAGKIRRPTMTHSRMFSKWVVRNVHLCFNSSFAQ